jgi:transposase-like protein
MDIHKNARLTLYSREQLAQKVLLQGSTLKAAAAAFNVTAKTAAKWVPVLEYYYQGTVGIPGASSVRVVLATDSGMRFESSFR